MDTFFQIVVLIFSVVIHEVSHGFAARRLGDHTAEYAGRLTLNPIPHIDLWGSIIVPAVLLLSNAGFVVGWAKPVPINPYNLRGGRWGEAIVAGAGPLSNIVLALIFGLAIRLRMVGQEALPIVFAIVLVNVVLAIFNLVPVPPLDGSKILFALLPDRLLAWRENIERYGLIVTFIFVIFLWQYFTPIVTWVIHLIVG